MLTVRVFVLFFMLLHVAISSAQDIQNLKKSLVLGNTRFESTCKTVEANEHFLLGGAFLHAMMYDLALFQFQQAQAYDPGCPMAYWGEAMANKSPIWSMENLSAAQNVLKRYEKNKDIRTLSAKENEYIAAAKILFSNKSLFERDRAYESHMAEFYKKFPDDPNVGSLYSLSLLGSASDFPKDTSNPQRMNEGKKIINQLFNQFPDHPGVVHYFIHYHDSPDRESAAQALPAAKIALTMMRSSSHVTHMAAHIYRRLELWEDYIHANQISVAASNALCESLGEQPLYACDAENKYHSLEWLHEGYLKTGKFDEANKLVKSIAEVVVSDSALKYKQWYYRMWSRQVLATQNWSITPIMILPIAEPGDNLYWSAYSECGALLASGFLAVHQGRDIGNTLERLHTIAGYTKQLEDPYIYQSCHIANLMLLKERALAERVDTELTPSLDILPLKKANKPECMQVQPIIGLGKP